MGTSYSDYLTNHSQRVVDNEATSQPSPVISGVPQGSVLGSLLYINNLFEVELSTGAKLHFYADDHLQTPSCN